MAIEVVSNLLNYPDAKLGRVIRDLQKKFGVVVSKGAIIVKFACKEEDANSPTADRIVEFVKHQAPGFIIDEVFGTFTNDAMLTQIVHNKIPGGASGKSS